MSDGEQVRRLTDRLCEILDFKEKSRAYVESIAFWLLADEGVAATLDPKRTLVMTEFGPMDSVVDMTGESQRVRVSGDGTPGPARPESAPTDVERKQMAVMLYAEYARTTSPNFFGLPKVEIERWLDVADVAFALAAERREPAP